MVDQRVKILKKSRKIYKSHVIASCTNNMKPKCKSKEINLSTNRKSENINKMSKLRGDRA